MAQTIELKGFVLAQKENWRGELDYTWCATELVEHGYMTVCQHTLTFALPEGFDPITAQIRMLEKQREKLRAELGKRITEISEQIQSLQAIEYTPSEVAA
jgi:hypothetical protein